MLIFTPYYFPNLYFFASLQKEKKVYVDIEQKWDKKYPINRCYVLTSNKIQILTIPMEKKYRKGKIKNAVLDYSTLWQKKHWRTISFAYQNTPYFQYYQPYIEDILFRHWDFLFQFNMEMIRLLLDFLGIKTELQILKIEEKKYSTSFDTHLPMKPYYSPTSTYRYHQIFSTQFVSNLSILDLLFHQGVYAKEKLKEIKINE